MACADEVIVDGQFVLSCYDSSTVTGRFTAENTVTGHYVAHWPGFGTEEADWSGGWVGPVTSQQR